MSTLKDLINEAKAEEAAERETRQSPPEPMPTVELSAQPNDVGIVKVPSYRYEDLLRSEFELNLIRGLIRTCTGYIKTQDEELGEITTINIYEMDFFQGLKAIAPDFYKSLFYGR